MPNNNLSIIENYNELFTRIRKATTADEMRALFADVKKFVAMYENIDTNTVKQIFQKYTDKLHTMLSENDVVFARLSDKAEEIRKREYDFTKENDDISAVQTKVLQLMGQLPKVKTTANTATITNIIEQAIKSGVIGCKATCELLKYPIYFDMINERQKTNAFTGSKSENQRTFERVKEEELQKVEKTRSTVYLDSFHLRNLEKQVKSFRKSSIWA